MPLHVVTLSELAAVVTLIASVIYLLGFFGIDFVQSVLTGRHSHDGWDAEDEINSDRFIIEEDSLKKPCGAGIDCSPVVLAPAKAAALEVEQNSPILEVFFFEIQRTKMKRRNAKIFEFQLRYFISLLKLEISVKSFFLEVEFLIETPFFPTRVVSTARGLSHPSCEFDS